MRRLLRGVVLVILLRGGHLPSADALARRARAQAGRL